MKLKQMLIKTQIFATLISVVKYILRSNRRDKEKEVIKNQKLCSRNLLVSHLIRRNHLRYRLRV